MCVCVPVFMFDGVCLKCSEGNTLRAEVTAGPGGRMFAPEDSDRKEKKQTKREEILGFYQFHCQ